MNKNLFQPGEIKTKEGEFKLGLVHTFEEPVEEVEVEEVPQYTGPTADDLKREAEDFKVQWESEKQKMLDDAQAQANAIIESAKNAAFEEVKKQTDEAQTIKAQAETEAQKIIADAREQASQIQAKSEIEKDEIKRNSYEEGLKEGKKDGYDSGKEEVNRLIDRSHKILEAVLNRREQILNETEEQIIQLVLLMTRKVVKVMSENQKSVVMANVLSALKKVKARGDVTIRVNLEDVKLTTEHIKDFIEQVESVSGITVVEDSSVEKGGCIVETDFGAIDARISSQLSELESKILEISPMKPIQKNPASAQTAAQK
ncbi:MAG: flagellar assembly protein FliH [Treponema berlinense]|uniref:flagellar assembly protein FliH n=1 Tax=Treponema TaxID=157 RepID=UPI002356B303|nr:MULTISPECIES: flagellar assembly protein FliH [Treponema]MBQ9103179.1 flagellar assembly protein FliH [Treponema sp.]MCI5541745.1 flagellar assembly protein FliH [Treponema berlinense]MDD5834288.1 flagellar assembly protein FliH [Treponema berlinense]MDY3707691.1 flagellar assembly protein FliH [Treponema berlinense]